MITRHKLAPKAGLVTIRASRRFRVLGVLNIQALDGAYLIIEEELGEQQTHGFGVTDDPKRDGFPCSRVDGQRWFGCFQFGAVTFQVWGQESLP